jgi:hypothetical protein
MLRTFTFSFLRRRPRFEVYRKALDLIAVGSCHVLLSDAVATKSLSS